MTDTTPTDPKPGTVASAEEHLERIARYDPERVRAMSTEAKLSILALQATADAQVAQARALEALVMLSATTAVYSGVGDSIFTGPLRAYFATLATPTNGA